MGSGYCLALFLSQALLPLSPVTAQAPDAKPGSGANAALQYWQAFALLPTLDKDQEKLLQELNKVPLNAAALKLIDRSRLSRVYLHRGAQLPRCDWGLDYTQGIRLHLPHLGKARTLASLAALHARHEFEQGHWKTGADDVIDLLKLARHLEMDQMIIPNLVGYAIERTAIEAAAPYLPEMKAVLPEAATSVLDAPPTAPTFPQMVLFEKQIGAQWLIQELKNTERHKAGSWQAVWKEIFDPPEHPEPGALQAAKSFEQAVQLLEDLLPFYDEQARVLALPWKEFDAQYPELIKKAKAANPLAGSVLPDMGKVVQRVRLAQTQRALFKAALAVVQGGPDKLKDIKDPFGDGPFEYRALDNGFELKSKLLYQEKPLTLTVGQGKKE
jgi:hypothetical protein